MQSNSTHCLRGLATITGLAIGLVALTAQAQVNVTLSSKTFTPASIAVGGQSTLTVNITNATGAQIDNVTFTDTFPAGLTFADFGTPTFSPGCVGPGVVNGVPGTGSVNGTVFVAANSTCTMQFLVTSNIPGTYTNSTASISGWNGNALAFAAAQLQVVVQVATIPTLSDWALIMLSLLMAGLAFRFLRQRTKSNVA